MHLAPTCRTSRGQMRGVGATCTVTCPNYAWTSQRHGRPGIRQDWRGMSAASSPFRQKGDSRLAATGRSGFRQRRSTGWAGRVQYQHRHSRSARRCACSAGRMTGRPRYSARRAKVGFGGEFGSNRAARADGTGVWVWNRQSRAAGTHGARFGGSHRGLGNGGCCEVGEAAGLLFDATARNNYHEYADRSLTTRKLYKRSVRLPSNGQKAPGGKGFRNGGDRR
jgi:hypothetical protein